VSGRRVVSSHGFVQWFCNIPFFFYRFEGAEVFYVCTGYHANDRVALYLPRSQTLIDFWEPLLRWHSLAEITRAFEVNLVDHRREVASYLGGPTRPAAVTGSDNLGHFIWTDLAGLHYAAANGLLEPVAELVEFERAFLPVAEVIPEMAALPAARFNEPGEPPPRTAQRPGGRPPGSRGRCSGSISAATTSAGLARGRATPRC
jgi:hypothetical protein